MNDFTTFEKDFDKKFPDLKDSYYLKMFIGDIIRIKDREWENKINDNSPLIITRELSSEMHREFYQKVSDEVVKQFKDQLIDNKKV